MFELCSIVRGSVELSYLMGGSGPVVVLLHALAGESAEFAPTMGALAGEFRVVALDQRGHSCSTRRPTDVSREPYVQDVVSLIEYVNPDAPVHRVMTVRDHLRMRPLWAGLFQAGRCLFPMNRPHGIAWGSRPLSTPGSQPWNAVMAACGHDMVRKSWKPASET